MIVILDKKRCLSLECIIVILTNCHSTLILYFIGHSSKGKILIYDRVMGVGEKIIVCECDGNQNQTLLFHHSKV